MQDNDRLFAMRVRAEKTLALIKQMNESFKENPDENIILAIMASNFDSFWEGYTWRRDENLRKIESLMKTFASRFYASDYLADMDADIKVFLQSQGYKYE